MDFTIRTAVLADYNGLCKVFAEVDDLHREHHPELFCDPPNGITRSMAYLEELLANPNASVLVAEDRDQVIGAVITILHDSRPIPILVPRRFAVIDLIAVLHIARRYGVGKALMIEAEAWAQSKGAGQVELNVFLFNQPAIRFYESIGYHSISQKLGKTI